MFELPNSDASPPTDLGYYYTDWIWQPGSIDFIKSMLLFFDGLTLALPSDIAERMIDGDPILATPLAERGLLTNFVPAATLDEESADLLADALSQIVRRYPFKERLPLETLGSFHWGKGLPREGLYGVSNTH